MTGTETHDGIPEDAHALAERLARSCEAAGLVAEVLAPTRVRAYMPGANGRLAEVIRIMPDEAEALSFFWSWGERICPVAEIDRAVASIKHVVTPPVHSTF